MPEGLAACAGKETNRTSRQEPSRHTGTTSGPDRDHVKYVAAQSCLVCGRHPADAHHIRFAQHSVMGRRVSDEFTVPLCRGHHRALHRAGDEAKWWKETGIDPMISARICGLNRILTACDPDPRVCRKGQQVNTQVGATCPDRRADLTRKSNTRTDSNSCMAYLELQDGRTNPLGRGILAARGLTGDRGGTKWERDLCSVAGTQGSTGNHTKPETASGDAKIRKRRPAAAQRARAEMARRPHDPARGGDQPGDRAPLRARRTAAPAGASVLVPVVRRGDGDGLAFLRHHHQRHRRAQARARRRSSGELGIHVCGGRGKHSRQDAGRTGRDRRARRLRRRGAGDAPAGSSPRSTARPCRTASISICTASSSPTTANGSWCSRA